jgi:hypothetical protein
MNGVIKGYVRNRARPDGSIAQGFLTEECISVCTNYLDVENPVGLPRNKHLDRLNGVGHKTGRSKLHMGYSGRRADFDREVDLGGSLGYMMLWPKEMIRLDHPGTASNSEPLVRSALPSNPIIGSTSTSQKLAEPVGSAPSQGKGTMPPVAPSPIEDDPAADDPIEPEAQNNMDPIDAFITDFDGPFEVDIATC